MNGGCPTGEDKIREAITSSILRAGRRWSTDLTHSASCRIDNNSPANLSQEALDLRSFRSGSAYGKCHTKSSRYAVGMYTGLFLVNVLRLFTKYSKVLKICQTSLTQAYKYQIVE